MQILGYSERGIINSLIFSIGEDKRLMDKFINLIGIPALKEIQTKDYTILLEQSFSRFGDSDLVIITEHVNPKHRKVFFIEGKVKTSQSKNGLYLNSLKNLKEKKNTPARHLICFFSCI